MHVYEGTKGSARCAVGVTFADYFHTLDRQITVSIIWVLICRSEMPCRTCTVQIQHRKLVLAYADYTAITRQRELEIIQIRDMSALPGRSRSPSGDRSYRLSVLGVACSVSSTVADEVSIPRQGGARECFGRQ